MKFWYIDNWYGNKYEFRTLRDAKAAAIEETGIVDNYFLHRWQHCLYCSSEWILPSLIPGSYEINQ